MPREQPTPRWAVWVLPMQIIIPTQIIKILYFPLLLPYTMPDSNSDIEKRITDVCESATSEEKPNIAELARQFGVLY